MLNWLYLSGNILYDIFKLFAGTKKLKFGLEEKGQRMRDLWTKSTIRAIEIEAGARSIVSIDF